MKKLLLGIITALIIILIGITIVKGITIGKLKILGLSEIKNKNEQLDNKVKEATKLSSTDYQKKIDELNVAIKKFQAEKTNYDDMVSVSTDSEVEAANQSYENMIEFLLIRLENHAKSEGVTIDLAISKSSSGVENVYNLNFTAVGTYVGIEEFITDIEDDSKLGYKIENFKMTSSSENGNKVQATFVCKNITIEGISANSTNTSDENISNSQNKDQQNATNTTNTTDNTNNANTTQNSNVNNTTR